MNKALLCGLALLGATNCGSSNGQTNVVQVTYSYAADQQITLIPGGCMQVVGPVSVNGDGKTTYQVQALSTDNALTLVIIPHSFFYYEGCNFTTGQTLVDVQISGSAMATVDVIADSYDLVATCTNPAGDNCIFNLTWSATY